MFLSKAGLKKSWFAITKLNSRVDQSEKNFFCRPGWERHAIALISHPH